MEGNRKIKGGIITVDIAEELCKHHVDKPLNLANADTILDMIYWDYIEQNNIDNEKTRELFDRLRELVPLTGRAFDEVFNLVCDLCLEFGRLAFINGLRFGYALQKELS